MSYQVLARKWRPRAFEQMAGQEHVLRALINGLDSGRLHHAYLFTGTRGVGKTSIARIIARCLNCEQGVSSRPCGECGTCREIDEGRFVDLIEVDAASRTKVEDTRELLDNVQYAPTRGRFKVYLIDEIHMLSGHSFNALLKTLEEPPPHVKFLLATTDPQKIPVTILSRCLQFSLKRLSPALISEYLQGVLEAEGIAWEAPAVAEIARAADGSMRDALSLLDQAIAFGGGAVKDEEVRSMLGTLDRELLFDLLDALAAGDAPAVLAVVERMAERAPDFSDALDDLLAALHHTALLQAVPDSLGEEVPALPRLRALAEALPREDVQLFYQIALNGRRDLPLAPDPRGGFEMTLLRMLAFRPAGTAPRAPRKTVPATRSAEPDTPRAPGEEAPPTASSAAPEVETARARSGERRAARARAALEAATAAAAQATKAAAGPQTAEPAVATPVGESPEVAAPVAPAAEAGAVKAAAPEAPAPQAVAAEVAAPEIVDLETTASKPAALDVDIDIAWAERVRSMGLDGVVQALAMQCEWIGQDGDLVQLRMDPGHRHLRAGEQRLQLALSEQFGREMRLEIVDAVPEGATPADLAEQARARRQQAAVESIESDPNVAALREVFAAEVLPNTIEPLK